MEQVEQSLANCPATRRENGFRGSRGTGYLLRGTLVVLLLAVAYPLSLKPACWTMARLRMERTQPRLAHAVSSFYQPLAPWILYGPPFVQRPMRWWIGVGMSPPTVYHSLPDGIA